MNTKITSKKEAQNYVGKTVEITNNSNSHGFTIGSKAYINYFNSYNAGCGSASYGASKPNNNNSACGAQWTLKSTDFRLDAVTEEDMLKNIGDYEDKILAIEGKIEITLMKIAFLRETGGEKYSETEFKAFNVLKALEKEGLTDIAKAKLIASIVEG